MCRWSVREGESLAVPRPRRGGQGAPQTRSHNMCCGTVAAYDGDPVVGDVGDARAVGRPVEVEPVALGRTAARELPVDARHDVDDGDAVVGVRAAERG